MTVGGLSAHADRTELLEWVRPSRDAEVRLVHGETGPLESLRDALRAAGRRAEIQPSEIDVPGAGHRAEAGE